MIVRLLGLAGLGALLTVTALTATPSVAAAKSPYQCMTDDGYGRVRPCSSLYWQGSNGVPAQPQKKGY